MTLQECYEQMDGDYSDALGRLHSEALIERFVLRYPEQDTFELLREAVEKGNIEESFSQAHTLKGIAANLSLSGLNKAASELTEQLRAKENEADRELFLAVETSHKLVLSTIEKYAKGMG